MQNKHLSWMLVGLLVLSIIFNCIFAVDFAVKNWMAEQTDHLTKDFITWADEAENGDLNSAKESIKAFGLTVQHVYWPPLWNSVQRVKMREYERTVAAYSRLAGHSPDPKEFVWIQEPKPAAYGK